MSCSIKVKLGKRGKRESKGGKLSTAVEETRDHEPFQESVVQKLFLLDH